MDWLDILGKVFELLILPAITVAAGYFVTWLKAKKDELKAKLKNETANKYIDMLDKTISECVLATSQTYVESLKKAGTFDGEAQKQAFKLTYDAVMDILTDDAKEILGEAVTDLGAYVSTKIEAAVNTNKK
jgi:hypothetical protein